MITCPCCKAKIKIIKCANWYNLTSIFYPICENCGWTTYSYFDTKKDAIEWTKSFSERIIDQL